MTTYSEASLSDTALSHKKIGSMQQARALRDNPKAIAEQAIGAPIQQGLWHPYNSVTVGDGNDGVFWDHAVDGDTGPIESPTLADGYQYALRIEGLSPNGGTPTVLIQLYLATTATWITLETTDAHSAGNAAGGFFVAYGLRQTRNGWGGFWDIPFTNQGGVVVGSGDAAIGHATAQKIGKLRVNCGVPFDAGTVALYRRRDLLGNY